MRTGQGVSLTVRADVDAGATFSGPEDQMDALIQRGAEAVYEDTEPYRYATYLRSKQKTAEAAAIWQRLSLSGAPSERAWALVGLSITAKDARGSQAGLDLLADAMRLAPWSFLPVSNTGILQFELSHPEAARAAFTRAASTLGGRSEVRPELIPAAKARNRGYLDLLRGDNTSAADDWLTAIRAGPQGSNQNYLARLMRAHLGMHDLAAAHADLMRPDPSAGRPTGSRELDTVVMAVQLDVALDNWAAALSAADNAAPVLAHWPGIGDQQRAQLDPLVAYAKARAGDTAGALALIATTPLDCYDCLRYRAKIAALSRDWPTANRWFVEAARQAPSIPFAFTDWGEMLLAKGDVAGAVAKLDQAHKVGPQFADPLKLWGDALVREGRPKEALAKYDEALKYAPAWPALRQVRDAAAKKAA